MKYNLGYRVITALRTVRKAGLINKCFSSVSTPNYISTNSPTSKQGQKWCWNNKTRATSNLYLFKITRFFFKTKHIIWIDFTIKIWSLDKCIYVSNSNKIFKFKIFTWKCAFKKMFVLLRYFLARRLMRSICLSAQLSSLFVMLCSEYASIVM